MPTFDCEMNLRFEVSCRCGALLASEFHQSGSRIGFNSIIVERCLRCQNERETQCLFKYGGLLFSFEVIKKVVTSRGAGYAGYAVLIYLENYVVIDGVPNPTITLDFKYLDDAEECLAALKDNLPNVFNKIVSSAERYKLNNGV